MIRWQDDPNYMERLAKRFWARVDKRGADECWPWLGCLAKKSNRGYIGFRDSTITAYRASWIIANGEVPPSDMDVCHSCDDGRAIADALWRARGDEDAMRRVVERSLLGRRWYG